MQGEARAAFGDALAAAGREKNPALPDEIAGRLHGKAFVARP